MREKGCSIQLSKRIDIEEILTIVTKHHTEKFYFQCENRPYAGFVLVLEGEIVYIDRFGDRHILKRGDLVPLFKHDCYSTKLTVGCRYIATGIQFDERYKNETEKLPIKYTCNEAQIKELEEMAEKWQTHSWDSFMFCKIRLLKLYLDIMSRVYKKVECADKDVRHAINYIHNNFKRSFTIEEVASHCMLSKSYMRAKFNKYVGMSITEYRERLRIDAAKDMLRSGAFSQKEIADELGYYDVSHFSRTFVRYCGITPKKYR